MKTIQRFLSRTRGRFLSLMVLILMLFSISIGNVWAATITFNVKGAGSGTSYIATETEYTSGSTKYKLKNWIPNTGQVRGNNNTQANNFYIYNSTAIPGTISGISISGGSYTFSYIKYDTGTSAIKSHTTTNTMSSASATISNGTGTYFRLNFLKGATSGTQCMTSVTITFCPNPTDLTNGTITANGAHLSWSDSYNTNSYEVYVSTSSTTPAYNATPTATGGSGKSVDVTGLNASTTYNWWVRSKSSDTSKSQWVKGTNFTTSAGASTYTIYVPDTYNSCSSVGSYTSNKGTEGSGTGSWTGYKTYSGITAGTTVTITATPESGYQFDGWTDNGVSIIMDDGANEITPSSTTSNTATFDMPSSDVYIMECEFSSSCSNSMTINKGTGTNCTFTLGTSGSGIASCSGVSTTVTISPNQGYGKDPSVTQSGASAAPTITGSGNNWTVAYGANTTGTSTINVSCAANDYTITLDKDLTPTTAGTASITATYNANTNLTSAITKPTKTGWTFAGYFTAKNGGGTQIIGADGNVIASVSGYTDASKNWKYVGNITLYAKWTCTVTWSVNEATNVYSAQTVTYNSSSCKVASVPTPSVASYCGDKFMGWTTEESVSQNDDTGLNLFSDVSGSPTITGNTTFYAVFADYDD